jgi:alkylated DNA repair dioxygenase AlkB
MRSPSITIVASASGARPVPSISVAPVIAMGRRISVIARDNSRVTDRMDLDGGAWLEYVRAWLDGAEADRALGALRDELAWEQREVVVFARRVLQPRLIAWAGSLGYRYSGQTLEPRAPTPTVAALLARVVDHARVPFNHVLVNRYRDGADSIGLHADDEPELGRDPVVATLSLGATRRFVLKPRRARLGAARALDVDHGSLLVMGGTCQRHYVHGVPRQASVTGERISLTFRSLLRAP